MNNTFTIFMDHEANLVYTANGAAAYATTNNPLLDCNFSVSNWRISTEGKIISNFFQAFNADPIMAVTWLFFLRDCRGGLGERRSFRIITEWLNDHHKDVLDSVIKYIPEYGRWDDLIELVLLGNDVALAKIIAQLDIDWHSEHPSLLAKWMPSANTSSQETVKKGRKLAKLLHMTETDYRKTLSCLRKKIDIVETHMSANDWKSINYETVPAKAAMNYANAFMAHDPERRLNYIKQVIMGQANANLRGLNPYEIWNKCISNHGTNTEELYNAIWDKFVEEGLPNTDAFNNCICVIDTSGSMNVKINKTVSVRDIAYSLGKYFSSKAKGVLKDKCITFSEYPEWIDLSNCHTPYEAAQKFNRSNWGMNTDMNAVFNMLLHGLVTKKINPEDMPSSILIISDMQFDSCVEGCYNCRETKKLFDVIAEKWHEHGFKLPKLIFWSVTTGYSEITVPQIDCGDNGISLISGYSQNVAKAAMSEKKDPYESLLEVLLSDRYAPIREALK